MARMFPPFYKDPSDRKVLNDLFNAEKLVYEAFEQGLSDDYMVFHSYKWIKRGFGESDFFVYHRKKGLIIFEVKGGEITYAENQWSRINRDSGELEYLDPHKQLFKARGQMLDAFRKGLGTSHVKMPVHIAMWFPNVQFVFRDKNLPIDPDLILDRESLSSVLEVVEKIFAQVEVRGFESHLEIEKVLFPMLNVVSSYENNLLARDHALFMLTRNQSMVLEFTEFQPYTAISGGAGTGKTVVAEEKVRRLARQYPEDQILFLCFNSALKDVLALKFEGLDNVYATNYDNLVWDYCSPTVQSELRGNYVGLRAHFYEEIVNGVDFPYKHIVIDEAQDFEDEWLEVLSFTEPEHLYFFYDRNQDLFVNKKQDSSWIIDMDCKLTLNINCRNTKQIAKLVNQHMTKSTFARRKSILNEVEGSHQPEIIYYDEVARVAGYIRERIEFWVSKGLDPSKKAKIISLRSARDSHEVAPSIVEDLTLNPDYLRHNIEHKSYDVPITTAGRVKGLEVDFVFLIDVDLARYEDAMFIRRLYVAASRAKHELFVFVKTPTKGEVKSALRAIGIEDLGNASTKKQLQRKYARELGAKAVF